MSDPISLTVTPGHVWQDASRVTAAGLNATATPQVKLEPTGAIGTDFLDMVAVTDSLTAAAAGKNYLRRSNFDPTEWIQAAGIEVAAGIAQENAFDWWCEVTSTIDGASVTVRRAEAAPAAGTRWGVELIGDSGISLTRFSTYVGPGVASALHGLESVSFALWMRNEEAAPITVQAWLGTSTELDQRAACTEAEAQTPTTLQPGTWTRIAWTFSPQDHATLGNGFVIGVKTAALNSSTKSLLLAQALLRPGLAPGAYTPAEPDAAARENKAPTLAETEAAGGARLLVQLPDGRRRELPPPPLWMAEATLRWNFGSGFPEWRDPAGLLRVFQCTGGDQVVTVPAGIGHVEVLAWGAPGGSEAGVPGGVGGFAYGTFPVTAGTDLVVVVGESGSFSQFISRRPYGFGGKAGTSVTHGGGLSGVFTGGAQVGAGDASRALVVAGGGGGVAYYDPIHGLTSTTQGFAGGNGGDTNSSYAGGESSMQGLDGSTTNCGGGGGYNGGSALPLGGGGSGRGGTSFTATGTGTGKTFTPRTTPVDVGQVLPVPGAANQYYAYQAGGGDRCGLVVLRWIPIP